MKNKIPLEIVKNPHILGGMPTIDNTRISVAGILTAISEGKSINEIVSNLKYAGYKSITSNHIVKVIQYARDLAI